MATIQSEPTPNPNSLKFTTPEGSFQDEGVSAFSSATEAEAHPLARRLFSIDGVEDVFVTPTFVTVSKESEVAWPDVQAQIKTALGDYLDADR
ncbi:MAG: NifU N-terminal domain-containing protein [Salinibacter sp.]